MLLSQQHGVRAGSAADIKEVLAAGQVEEAGEGARHADRTFVHGQHKLPGLFGIATEVLSRFGHGLAGTHGTRELAPVRVLGEAPAQRTAEVTGATHHQKRGGSRREGELVLLFGEQAECGAGVEESFQRVWVGA